MNYAKLLLLACLLSVPLAQAEEGDAGRQQAEPAAHRSPSPEGATLDFANLSDGDTVPLVFVVKFSVSGMGIAPAGTAIEHTGHHHLLVNVAELPDFNQPLPANENILHFGKGQTKTELTLPQGQHSLQLLFADHAHIPHDPPVMSDRIMIVVAEDAPPQSDESE